MISIKPIPSIAELEVLWKAISHHGQHTFYLSWPWIRTWLSCIPEWVHPQLLTVKVGEMVIAAAILVQCKAWRRGLVSSRTWVLNATGDSELDQIFIEDNGLLARDEHRETAWKAWAESFSATNGNWDEISFRGVPPEILKIWEASGFHLREDMMLPARYVDLADYRASGAFFTQRLKKKVRARIAHTRRVFEVHGPLVVETAGTLDEARLYFAQFRELHQKRWEHRGRAGSFSAPFFERFHTELIETHFHEGVIQLLRVRVGDEPVGVLYNFVHNGDILVYQSGFNFDLIRNPNKESPGLLTHALAIDFNAALGHRRYDLLAGDSEYKRTLSSRLRSLWWGRVQKPRLKFAVEDRLVAIKRRYFGPQA